MRGRSLKGSVSAADNAPMPLAQILKAASRLVMISSSSTRRPKTLEFVDGTGAIVAGGVGKNANGTATFAQLIEPMVCTGDHRFADVQHAKSVKNKGVNLIVECPAMMKCQRVFGWR